MAIDDLNQVVNFFITKGSASDVSMAAKLLQGRTGTAIGDKGYVSKNCGLNFIARAKRNMKEQNTAEEIAALSKRYKVKIFTGKLKTRLGDNVAHFRPWKAV
ncbi:MAG: transposase, partial [Puniceicoccales bacterium]|nr:transposase [Puniceicoccales bacterium]